MKYYHKSFIEVPISKKEGHVHKNTVSMTNFVIALVLLAIFVGIASYTRLTQAQPELLGDGFVVLSKIHLEGVTLYMVMHKSTNRAFVLTSRGTLIELRLPPQPLKRDTLMHKVLY